MGALVPLLLALTVTAGKAPAKPKFVVLDVEDVSGRDTATAKLLSQVVFSEVASTKQFDVLSSQTIRDMLGLERQRQLLGCTESSCLAELGGALGAQYLLGTRLGRLGSRFRLDLQLVDVSKSRVLATAGGFVDNSEDKLGVAVQAYVKQALSDAHLGATAAPTAATGADTVAAPTAAVSSSEGGTSHTGSTVAFVIGGAAAAAATTMSLIALHQYNSIGPGTDPGFADIQRRNARIADALWGTAIIAGATGTVLYFTAGPSSSGSGGEIGVGGRF